MVLSYILSHGLSIVKETGDYPHIACVILSNATAPRAPFRESVILSIAKNLSERSEEFLAEYRVPAARFLATLGMTSAQHPEKFLSSDRRERRISFLMGNSTF
jgi:hypothetical protein